MTLFWTKTCLKIERLAFASVRKNEREVFVRFPVAVYNTKQWIVYIVSPHLVFVLLLFFFFTFRQIDERGCFFYCLSIGSGSQNQFRYIASSVEYKLSEANSNGIKFTRLHLNINWISVLAYAIIILFFCFKVKHLFSRHVDRRFRLWWNSRKKHHYKLWQGTFFL